MPQNKAIWTSFIVPANGSAFDARHWNTLVAPNRNLDVINLSNQSSAYLNLTVSSLSVPNNTPTTILWDTAVYPNPNMWTNDPSYADIIYLVPNDNPYIALWDVNVNVAFALASAGTRKYVRIYFSNGSEYIIDEYEDHTANNPHSFNVVLLATDSLNPPYIYVDILHTSGSATTANASIYVQQIPTVAKNYFPDGYV